MLPSIRSALCSGSRIALLAVVTAGALPLAAGLAGCETFGQDMGELAGSFSPPSPLDAAVMAANMNNPDERREGLVLLSNASFGGDPAYVKLYREYATFDPDPLARAAAVRALARHGEPSDAVIIAAGLEHENHAVRWEAAKGMQRLHEPRVIPIVLKVLRDPAADGDVRAELANALGQYPDNSVFDGLLAALDARQLAINMAAERSLVTLTGKDLGPDAGVWLRWHRQTIAAGEDPFAGRTDYMYPTYQRKETFFEKLTFWSSEPREQPGPPVGSESIDRRDTYSGPPPEGSESSGEDDETSGAGQGGGTDASSGG